MRDESLFEYIVHQTFFLLGAFAITIILIPAAFIILPLWLIYNAFIGKNDGLPKDAPKN